MSRSRHHRSHHHNGSNINLQKYVGPPGESGHSPATLIEYNNINGPCTFRTLPNYFTLLPGSFAYVLEPDTPVPSLYNDFSSIFWVVPVDGTLKDLYAEY